MSITIELPWPDADLSPNARLHWARKARAVKQYREWACLAALAHRQEVGWPAEICLPITMDVVFHPRDRRRYDADNLMARMKAGIDGLRDARVIPDDTADVLHIGRVEVGEPLDGGCVYVTLTAAKR